MNIKQIINDIFLKANNNKKKSSDLNLSANKGTFTSDSMISCKTLYKATGLSDDDFERPIIGIANAYSDIVPGHKHLREISEQVKFGIYRAGGTPVEFGVIGVCDGVCTTHEGALYSLPTREIIADSIEMMALAHKFDGLVLVGSCDKTVPGMLMAAARLDIPSIFIAGGSMLGGPKFGAKEKSDSTVIAEAYGKYEIGGIDRNTLEKISLTSCPTIGSCQHMATANTMCFIAEALGMSVPGSSAIPAVYNERTRAAFKTGGEIVDMVKNRITGKDIINEKSIENAMKVTLAIGGSTNAILHIIAIANEVGINPKNIMDKFEEYGESVPLIAQINPSSLKYDAEDFYMAGGIPRVIDNMSSLLNMNSLTVTGKTLEENLRDYKYLYEENKEVITTIDKPFSDLPGLVIMRGNLAEKTAVAKPAAIAKEVRQFKGKAICFDSEDECSEAIINNRVKPGHVVVVRYAGPKGAPGMPEMFKPMKMLYGQGLNKETALITDGRFSGTNNGCFVGHISPEAAEGGNIALINDGDEIEIDVINKKINLLVSDEELEIRRKNFVYKPKKLSGYLKRYSEHASSADNGGILL